MEVRVLGPVQVVRDDGSEIDVGGPRSRALVARLALDAGRPISTAVLIEDLWGQDLPVDATNALQSVVSRTRRQLPAGTLQSTPAGYVLRADVDATRFRALVAQGRVADGLALWRGDVLADVRDAPFADRVAAGLAEARLAAVEQDAAARSPDAALIAELAELVREHPFRDGLWLTYLRALVACGRSSEALTAYAELRRGLADELGADPSADLQQLHAEILRGGSGGTRPRRRPRHRLPAAITSFVGREGAVRDVHSALGRHRLVTITGAGGAGKTRLAVESARSWRRHAPEAWLVELAAVTGEQDVLPAVLSALGLLEVSVLDRPTPAPDGRAARVPEAAGDAEGLLVLDNCEHVVDSAAAVAEELLRRAPGVRVLATSREPLRLTGECVYPLGSLAVPAAAADLDEAIGCSAVQLFTQRAQAVDRGFVLDEASLPAVGEICRRLDGQPLALELAAARLRTLTVRQVADRLSDRFRLLAGGSRTALPRHRSLRAVVEWSWDLLGERERDLAERIAVFAGGTPVRGAAAVLPVAADPESLLESLADKSLLVLARDAGRFHMLETVREFGMDRLVERGVAEQVRAAHLDYMLGLAEQLFGQMLDERQSAAIGAIDAERGNLTAALRFAIERQDRARAARLVRALAWYWLVRNEHRELNGWVHAVRTLPGAADPAAEIACAAVAALGHVLDQDEAGWRRLVDRILAEWDAHAPDDPVTAVVLATLAHFGLIGERVLPPPADPVTRSMVGLMRLVLVENSGRAMDRQLLARTIDGFRHCGGGWGLAASLGLLGTVLAYDGDLDGAAAAWAEALPVLESLGAHEDAAVFWLRMQTVRLALADADQLAATRRELAAQLESGAGHDGRHRQVMLRLSLAGLEHVAGNDRAAAEHLRACLAAGGRLRLDDAAQREAMTLALLALVTAGAGDLDGARDHFAAAARIATRTRDMPVVAYVGVAAAVIVQRIGDERRAARLLGAAVAIRGCEDRSNRDAEELARALRRSLGDAQFDALYAEGAGLDQQAAVEASLRPL